MENMLLDIAEGVMHPASARVAAAEKLHAICEGQPVSKNINLNVDDLGAMNAADIDAELARLERAETAVAAGTVAPALPGASDPLVH